MAQYKSSYTGPQIDAAIDTVYNLADVATSGDYNDLINTPSAGSKPYEIHVTWDSQNESYSYSSGYSFSDFTDHYTNGGESVVLVEDGDQHIIYSLAALVNNDTYPYFVNGERFILLNGSSSIIYSDAHYITENNLSTYTNSNYSSNNKLATMTDVAAGGAVTSVNTKTGAVTLTASDVSAVPSRTESNINYVQITPTASSSSTKFDVILNGDNGTSSARFTIDASNSSNVSATLQANRGLSIIPAQGYSGLTISPSSITGLAAPTADNMAANKKYVDDAVAGVSSPVIDVKVNNTSILSSGVANLVTNTAYNASTNKIATMSDIPDTSGFALNSELHQEDSTTGNESHVSVGNSSYVGMNQSYDLGDNDISTSEIAINNGYVEITSGGINGGGVRISGSSVDIHNVTTPSNNGDAANKKYVDDSVSGITHPVTSINNKTGAVVLTASDVGALADTTKLAYQGSISLSGTTATLSGIPINALYWSVRNNNGTGLHCIYVHKSGDDAYIYRVTGYNYSGGDVQFDLTCCMGSTVYHISTGTYSAASTSTSMTGTYSSKSIPSAAAVNDVTINGTSILSSGTANIVTNTAYNASSNKIATMSDLPTVPSNVSSFTNDAGYLTLATLPIYNGEVS